MAGGKSQKDFDRAALCVTIARVSDPSGYGASWNIVCTDLAASAIGKQHGKAQSRNTHPVRQETAGLINPTVIVLFRLSRYEKLQSQFAGAVWFGGVTVSAPLGLCSAGTKSPPYLHSARLLEPRPERLFHSKV